MLIPTSRQIVLSVLLKVFSKFFRVSERLYFELTVQAHHEATKLKYKSFVFLV